MQEKKRKEREDEAKAKAEEEVRRRHGKSALDSNDSKTNSQQEKKPLRPCALCGQLSPSRDKKH